MWWASDVRVCVCARACLCACVRLRLYVCMRVRARYVFSRMICLSTQGIRGRKLRLELKIHFAMKGSEEHMPNKKTKTGIGEAGSSSQTLCIVNRFCLITLCVITSALGLDSA